MFATSRKWLVWPSSCGEVSRCAPLRPHTACAHALTCTRNARPSEYHGVTPIFFRPQPRQSFISAIYTQCALFKIAHGRGAV